MAMTWVLEIPFDTDMIHSFSRQLFSQAHVESEQLPSRTEHNPAYTPLRASEFAFFTDWKDNFGLDNLDGKRSIQDDEDRTPRRRLIHLDQARCPV